MNAVDTNVLVYACDQEAGRKQEIAIKLLEETTPIVLLWQVACEFISASRKLAAKGFAVADAWEMLDDWLALYPLLLPSREILIRSRCLHQDSGVSFWDATIIAAAAVAGVRRLYSEDLPGRRFDDLEIVNPFATA